MLTIVDTLKTTLLERERERERTIRGSQVKANDEDKNQERNGWTICHLHSFCLLRNRGAAKIYTANQYKVSWYINDMT